MNHIEVSKELISFISNSPSMFHSISTIETYLTEAGFTYLPEGQAWQIEKGHTYYTTRNHSSIIAFHVGEQLDDYHFQMTASHSDSPTYKVKTVPELNGPHEYLRLDVEGYGGMIDSTWFDRPLSVAGRVLVKTVQGIENRLLYIDKDILMIPNLAIHMNRSVNDGYKYNRQVDLCPLFSCGALKKNRLLYIDKDILMIPNLAIHMNRSVNDGYKYNRQVDLCPLFSCGALKNGAFDQMVADELGVQVEDILGKDLFLVNRQAATIWGWKDEFVSSPKLDDLQCAFVSLKAFLASSNPHAINVYTCFDNEEVGSNTKQGAMSTFLQDVLKRINYSLHMSEDAYYQAIARSFLVSCDNAHALHPNHSEKSDVVNCTFMNKGIVIKESANQKYTTDAFSRAVFTSICQKANVPVQFFANRSDMVGGSTLGNLSNTQVSVNAVDIGLAQLAMHSSFETGGILDTAYAIEALTTYYGTNIKITESQKVEFE